MYREITVSSDGNGQYDNITTALKSVKKGEGAKIYIKNGIYKEKLIIDVPNIELIGENAEDVIITYDDSAFMLGEDGNPIGTFKTATVHVTGDAKGFSAENLTIENSAGDGKKVGQAVALYLDCDEAVIKHCRLLGKQDTLLTAPIHDDIAANPDLLNRQYFESCYIEGDVDFIFGGAVAVFKDCVIHSLARDIAEDGYITAACTSENFEFGYVFFDCELTGSADENSVYLGRPWREYAKTVFVNCKLDNIINEQGFSKWNDTNRHETCYYAQYGSYGEGYNENSLADWSHVLSNEQVEKYTIDNIFRGWKPRKS